MFFLYTLLLNLGCCVVASNEHHKSKKKVYTVIVVSEEEARKSKAYRIKRWHIIAGVIGVIAAFFGIFWSLIVYTPVGYIFPITSPGLRNQYTQQLVDLHQRLASMMDELVVLRTYNEKLRKALGDTLHPKLAQVQWSDTVRESGVHDPYGNGLQPDMQKASISWYEHLKAVPVKTSAEVIQRPYQFPAIFPTQGYVTRGFDPSINHFGVDIAGKVGSLIYAACDGTIVFSGWTQTEGYIVILSHSDGFVTVYKHNDTLLKYQGTRVRRGEAIALLGNTGETSQGPHLHFEIWKDGVPVDPAQYIINYSL